MNDAETSLRIRRTLPVSREQVFRAWTEAEAIQRWFKPNGMITRVTQLDLRVGGSFQFDLTHTDGKKSYIAGTYIEIERPRKLVFTWLSDGTDDRETLVTVEFVEYSGVTEIVLTHERFADEAMTQNHQQGWNPCLDLLTAILQ